MIPEELKWTRDMAVLVKSCVNMGDAEGSEDRRNVDR